jgi:hypothetical protein
VDEAFKTTIDSKLDAFRDWARQREFHRCRLVQYCGVDLVGSIDVPLGAIESQIECLLGEAFRIDWDQQSEVVYLRVWEGDDLVPPWSNVFAEEPLADIEAILREARQHAQ